MFPFVKRSFRAFLCIMLCLSLCIPPALGEVIITITDPDGEEISMEIFETEPEPAPQTQPATAQDDSARTAFIDDIIALAKEKYDEVLSNLQIKQI